MTSTTKSDAAGGLRRAGSSASAWALLLLLGIALPACGLGSPTQPADPATTTGQTTNQVFNCSCSIQIASASGTLAADDLTTVTISADVRDDQGNPISNLTPVTFSTNLGAFVDSAGNLFSALTANTFNGIAQVALASFNRATGTATVTAQIGDVTATINVEFEFVAVQGTVSLLFATAGTTSLTGTASAASPFETEIQATAVDLLGAVLAGVPVRFRIVKDHTLASGNGPARFLGPAETNTNSTGVANNVVRVVGAGDLVIVADLIDSSSGGVLSTSNQIILTTTTPTTGFPSLSLADTNGATAVTPSLSAAGELPVGLVATALDADGTTTLAGFAVRFTKVSDVDSTGVPSLVPALFPDGTEGPVTSSTNTAGQATTTINPTTVGQQVVVRAELLDSSGTVIATSNDVVITVIA